MKTVLTTYLFIITIAFNSFGKTPSGIIDVREAVEKEKKTSIRGDWEFYWGELLNSGEFRDEKISAYVKVPERWSSIKKSRKEYFPGQGFATYRIKVVLDTSKSYAIFTPRQLTSHKFFINGKEISRSGLVVQKTRDYKPYSNRITVPIEKELLRDTNEFVMQVANFHHSSGGTRKGIILGDQDHLLKTMKLRFLLDGVSGGALFIGSLFFMGLFLCERRQKSILYFALFCLVFGYFIISNGDFILHELVEPINWELNMRIEYGMIYLSTILLTLFIAEVYPQETPNGLAKVVFPVVLIYLGLAVFAEIMLFTALNKYYMILLIGLLLLGMWIYIKAAINNRPGALYSMIGTIALFSVLLLKSMKTFVGLEISIFVSSIAYLLYFFLQSLTLSQQFATAWKKTKDEALAALEVKSDFLSTMSHEIRTPMNAVIGLTNYMLSDEPKKEHLGTLKTLKLSAENLLTIINDILDFSKIEADKLQLDYQSVEIRKLANNLRKAFEPLAMKQDLGLTVSVEDDVPASIVCDPTRLSQVLTNLMRNALKFTQEGGVGLSIKLDSLRGDTCSLLFEVIDTGIGIEEEKIEDIFESFTQAASSSTREFGGTGLGLAITRKLLEKQNAVLKVRSHINRGSIFYFVQEFKVGTGQTSEQTELFEPQIEKVPDLYAIKDDLQEENLSLTSHESPINEENQEDLQKVDEKLSNKILDAKVLLVEDNPINVIVAKKFLEKWALQVEIAVNGKEAIDMVEAGEFDLVLMDIQMPVMDGYCACRYLRKRGYTLPILALTATAPERETQFTDAGMNDYATKPFDPDELFKKLEKLIKEEHAIKIDYSYTPMRKSS